MTKHQKEAAHCYANAHQASEIGGERRPQLKNICRRSSLDSSNTKSMRRVVSTHPDLRLRLVVPQKPSSPIFLRSYEVEHCTQERGSQR